MPRYENQITSECYWFDKEKFYELLKENNFQDTIYMIDNIPTTHISEHNLARLKVKSQAYRVIIEAYEKNVTAQDLKISEIENLVKGGIDELKIVLNDLAKYERLGEVDKIKESMELLKEYLKIGEINDLEKISKTLTKYSIKNSEDLSKKLSQLEKITRELN